MLYIALAWGSLALLTVGMGWHLIRRSARPRPSSIDPSLYELEWLPSARRGDEQPAASAEATNADEVPIG